MVWAVQVAASPFFRLLVFPGKDETNEADPGPPIDSVMMRTKSCHFLWLQLNISRLYWKPTFNVSPKYCLLAHNEFYFHKNMKQVEFHYPLSEKKAGVSGNVMVIVKSKKLFVVS